MFDKDDEINENYKPKAYTDITSLIIQYIILQFKFNFPSFENWKLDDYNAINSNDKEIKNIINEIQQKNEYKINELTDEEIKSLLGENYDSPDNVNKLKPKEGMTVKFKLPKMSKESYEYIIEKEIKQLLENQKTNIENIPALTKIRYNNNYYIMVQLKIHLKFVKHNLMKVRF